MKQFQMQLMPPLALGENLMDKFLEEFKEKQEEELTEKNNLYLGIQRL